MLHEIAPHEYDIEMKFLEPQADDLALCFFDDNEGHCLAKANVGDNGTIALPTCKEFEASCSFTYLFSIDGRPYYLVEKHAADKDDQPSNWSLQPVRKLIARNGDCNAFAIATGMHLREWYRNNRFCGRCGTPTNPSPHERALICPSCQNTVYPRISPAIIVAVVNEECLLLTRYAHGEYRKRALVAGFIEVGETPEQAVVREVWEECGVRVKNVRYIASQPWGLSGSLMLGFFAELDGNPQITLQDGELGWAGWVPREELDEGDDYALGRVFINAFKNGSLAQD